MAENNSSEDPKNKVQQHDLEKKVENDPKKIVEDPSAKQHNNKKDEKPKAKVTPKKVQKQKKNVTAARQKLAAPPPQMMRGPQPMHPFHFHPNMRPSINSHRPPPQQQQFPPMNPMQAPWWGARAPFFPVPPVGYNRPGMPIAVPPQSMQMLPQQQLKQDQKPQSKNKVNQPIGTNLPQVKMKMIPGTNLPHIKMKMYKPATKEELKALLHTYFTVEKSLRAFCDSQSVPDRVRKQLYRLIRNNTRLKELESMRHKVKERSEAIAIIDDMLPGPKYEESHAAVKEVGQKDDAFFSPRNIHNIAKKLDFSKEPRISRTGNKIIPIDKRVFTAIDDDARTLIIFLYKEVISRHGPPMSQNNKAIVLESAAKIVMYDHGYSEAKLYANIIKKSQPRMIEYFKTGIVGTNPLQGRVNASKKDDVPAEKGMADDEEYCPCGCKQIVKKGQFYETDSRYVGFRMKNGLSALQILTEEKTEQEGESEDEP